MHLIFAAKKKAPGAGAFPAGRKTRREDPAARPAAGREINEGFLRASLLERIERGTCTEPADLPLVVGVTGLESLG